MATDRRPATPEEAKALANPLRLRILRLCHEEYRTNKELADRLGRDPGTVLHHVRMLVDTGFLVAEPPRTGDSGALEKPYRATGKSWELSVGNDPGAVGAVLSMVDAFRDEAAEAIARGGAIIGGARFVVRLSSEDADELSSRLQALAEEFIARRDPDGEPLGVLLSVHNRAN